MTKSSNTDVKNVQADRRGFLKRAVVATGATTAAAVAAGAGAHVISPTDATPHRHKGSAGYQETEHVHTYYRLARF